MGSDGKIVMYLYESSLVTEAVTAVGAHTVKVGLVFPVTALRILAIFVEPTSQESLVIHWDFRSAENMLSYFMGDCSL